LAILAILDYNYTIIYQLEWRNYHNDRTLNFNRGLVVGFMIDVAKEMASGEMADKLVKPFLDRRTNHDMARGLTKRTFG